MEKEKNRSGWIVIDFFIITGYFLIWLICNNRFQNGDCGFGNFVCSLISCCMLLYGFRSFRRVGAKSYNIFIIVYFGTLMLNTLNLSGYQTAKEARDIYYYFIGGGIFVLWLYCGENVSYRIKHTIKIKQLNNDSLLTIVTLFYVTLSIYNFAKNGIPLIGGVYTSSALNMYKKGGISGVITILSYITLILSSESKKKKRYFLYGIVVLIEGVLKFSRGNIFRIFFFLFIVFIRRREVRDNMQKYKKYILTFVVLIIVGFGVLGNYRTYIRGERTDGSASSWFNRLIDANVNLGSFGWIYGYTAINFDAMKMVYYQKPLKNISTVLAPFDRIIGGSDMIEQYQLEHSFEGVREYSRFSINAMKIFLTPYIQDLGYFFFLELCLVGIIYMLFIAYSRNANHSGLYSYILMLICLSICGNYIFLTTYIYVVIGFIGLVSFTKKGDVQ